MSERENLANLYRVLDGDDQQMPILALILERQDAILDRISKFELDLAGHMDREEKALRIFIDALPTLPDGNPDAAGHKSFHTSLIEESRARTQMWRELRTELVKKGVFGLIAVLAFLAVYWWNGEMKR